MASWETVCELGSELPEVEQSSWYGTPALKVRGYEEHPALAAHYVYLTHIIERRVWAFERTRVPTPRRPGSLRERLMALAEHVNREFQVRGPFPG